MQIFYRALALSGAILLSGVSLASASPGCNQLNGTLGLGSSTGSVFGIGFSAGDTITGRVAINGSGTAQISLRDVTANTQLAPNGTGFTYIVPANTGNQIAVITLGAAIDLFEWSCVNAPIGTTPSRNSSQLLDQVRRTLAPMAATTSSTNIGESVTGAITDAFTGGGASQAYDGRIATSFAALENGGVIARSKQDAENAHDALTALGYAKGGIVRKAPPQAAPWVAPSPWHAWIDARYTALDDKRVSSFDARHTNVTGGLSYRFNDYFLLGLVAGYEDFNYELGFRNAKLDGNGWNAGGYFGWRFWDRLRLDGMLTYGRIDYGAQADNVTAGFDADRITSMLRLSGRYGLAAGWYLEPSARVIYANERQDAFVDTAGVAHSKYSFDVGLASFGGEVGLPLIASGWIFTPSVGLFGDYRFGDTDVATVATLPNLDDGWSARVTGGLRWSAANGFTAALGGDYGGLGSDTRFWRAKGSLGLKF